jgi:tetratricopeptide (TPR) repeat protein
VERSDGGALEVSAAPDDAPASIKKARAARALRSWHEAFAAFADADAAGVLVQVTDLEAFGEAAWWSGHPQESVAARLRAYAIHVERGAECEAAMVALDIAINYVTRRSMSVAGGWVSKASRHLAEQPERREQGHLAAIEALATLAQGDLETATTRARAAVDIGTRYRDRDLVAMGHTFEACVLARRGALDKAKVLFDEAMASASTGELGPFATGVVYCRTICTCLDLFDYRRASEWSQVVRECGNSHGADGFPGDCRAHGAAVLVHRGLWSAAVEEAQTACNETATFDLGHTGLASYELGVAQLRSGNLDAADEAFRKAHELGADAEPGLSMLQLARGETTSAAASLSTALQQAAGDPLRRARLLPTYVDVAIANADLDKAQAAVTELAGIAHDYDSVVLSAAAAFATGRLAFLSGDLDTSAVNLRESNQLWLTVDAPYEGARARLALGQTLAAQKNTEAALLELQAANAAFRRLGAHTEVNATAVAIKAITG